MENAPKGPITLTPVAGASTADCSKGNTFILQCDAANQTVTMANMRPGEDYILELTQDSVGSRTLTMSPVPEQGSAATLTPVTTATTGRTIYHFRCLTPTSMIYVAKQI